MCSCLCAQPTAKPGAMEVKIRDFRESDREALLAVWNEGCLETRDVTWEENTWRNPRLLVLLLLTELLVAGYGGWALIVGFLFWLIFIFILKAFLTFETQQRQAGICMRKS